MRTRCEGCKAKLEVYGKRYYCSMHYVPEPKHAVNQELDWRLLLIEALPVLVQEQSD